MFKFRVDWWAPGPKTMSTRPCFLEPPFPRLLFLTFLPLLCVLSLFFPRHGAPRRRVRGVSPTGALRFQQPLVLPFVSRFSLLRELPHSALMCGKSRKLMLTLDAFLTYSPKIPFHSRVLPSPAPEKGNWSSITTWHVFDHFPSRGSCMQGVRSRPPDSALTRQQGSLEIGRCSLGPPSFSPNVDGAGSLNYHSFHSLLFLCPSAVRWAPESSEVVFS